MLNSWYINYFNKVIMQKKKREKEKKEKKEQP